MIQYILFTVFFLFVGVQVGAFISLRESNVNVGRALSYSFVIYVLPLIIILAHLKMYKNRMEIVEEILEKKSITKEQKIMVRNEISSKKFLTIAFIWLIKDMLTPKDNIQIALEIAIKNEQRIKMKSTKDLIKIKETMGLVGIAIEFIVTIWNGMLIHAGNGIVNKEFA
ncbi:hypothetical protein [Viridibacillus arvi]|uniref:hypothetical protein n=1 Tax=Viridibacillus arvi TaxID=263475 RepID=UPI0034CF8FDB